MTKNLEIVRGETPEEVVKKANRFNIKEMNFQKDEKGWFAVLLVEKTYIRTFYSQDIVSDEF